MSLVALLLASALASAAALPPLPHNLQHPTAADLHSTNAEDSSLSSTITSTSSPPSPPPPNSHYRVLTADRRPGPQPSPAPVTTTTPRPATLSTTVSTTTAGYVFSDRLPGRWSGSNSAAAGDRDWEHLRPQSRPLLPTVSSDELRRMRNSFCREEPQDDDGEYRVPAPSKPARRCACADGDYNPRYEAVPGLGYYRFHPRPRNWHAARELCQREGGYLVVINSRQEADAVKAMHERCKHILQSHFNAYQYIGVHDQYDEGYWETVKGQPLEETGYEAWMMNQPDNAHHAGENCLAMSRFGYFNDVPCWVELPFTCEHK